MLAHQARSGTRKAPSGPATVRSTCVGTSGTPGTPEPEGARARFVHLARRRQLGEYSFSPGEVIVGRTAAHLEIPNDAALAPRHGALRIELDRCYATDAGCASPLTATWRTC